MSELDFLSRQLKSIALQSPLKISSHCQLSAGDTVGNYLIGNKLGEGRFAAVWAAKNMHNGNVVALKIYRMGGDNARYYENEVRILNHIFEYSLSTQTIPPNLVGYLGMFAHVTVGHDKGPRIHPCVIFNMGGDSLSKLLRHCRKQFGKGIPIPVVKNIMREILSALAYLHRCGIIHTDVKPSNILLNKRVEELDENGLSVCLADLGSSTFSSELFSSKPGTTQYIAPELIIDMPYTTAIDIWATFAMCFELITGDLLFDVYSECDITYGEDVDGEAMEGLESADDDRIVCDDAVGGRDASSDEGSSGDEDDYDEEKVSYRHLLLIAKVLGYPPREFTRNARIYYNRRDRLKNNPDITPVSIAELLFANYDMDAKDCQEIQNFLMTGLTYIPEQRITAEQALQHPWLNS